MKRVAIVGLGLSKFRKKAEESSFKELMFEVTKEAHQDAHLTSEDIESVVTTGEDLTEGRAIADEFVPDQIGGVLKPNNRICADSIYGLFSGFMQITSSLFDLVLVVGYDKMSEVVNSAKLTSFALDPIFVQPLGLNPLCIAALEMNRYMGLYNITKEQIALVPVKNKRSALSNPKACYGEEIEVKDVLDSEVVCSPLNTLDVSPLCDGVAAVILASEDKAKKITNKPIWIEGIGWSSDSSSAFWSNVELGNAGYIEKAGKRAYRMAGIKDPLKEIDLAEVDDRFSYKELQHIEALGLCNQGKGAKFIEEGKFPLNPSGGLLGMGDPHSAAGLVRVVESALQLQERAGKHQILKPCRRAVALGWSDLPSRSGGVVVLRKGK